MRKKLFCLLPFLALFTFAHTAHAKKGIVPMKFAEKAALYAASINWGQTGIGPCETYYGLDGQPAVYVFAFRLNSAGLFSESEILTKLKAGQLEIDKALLIKDSKALAVAQKIKFGEGVYATLMVSARYEVGPVLMHCKTIPIHYVSKNEAYNKAQSILKAKEPILTRILYASPFDIWYEYTSGDNKAYISPFSLKNYTAAEIFADIPKLQEQPEAERIWQAIQNGVSYSTKGTYGYITGVPAYDWSYGCSPTASANVLSYWDTYGYGNLVDFTFNRWDGIEGEWDYNVPNVQKELAIAMYTDTVPSSPNAGMTYVSNIGSGTVGVCYNNGYTFTCPLISGYTYSTIIDEIDNNRPVHWVVLGHPVYYDHSLTVVGYNSSFGQVCVHDSWTPTDVWVIYDWGSGTKYTIPIRPASVNLTAQNLLMDAGSVTNIGDISVDYQTRVTPYNFYWWPAPTLTIWAVSNIIYPTGTVHYFCSWSDGGNDQHIVKPTTSTTYTAYYKKCPLLKGYYDGSGVNLSWDWRPGYRPPYFTQFKLYEFGNSTPIYSGTGNYFYHSIYLASTDIKKYYLEAWVQSDYTLCLLSNSLKVSGNVGGDPIVSYSTTQEATSYSNGKKLVIDNTGKLHVVFASNDSVYYTASTDDGETWSTQAAIGEGKNPAIELNTSQTPSVCWSKVNELYYSEHSSDVWGAPQLIYTGPAGSEVSYLSYVLDQKTNSSYLGWVDEGAASAVYISPYTPGGSGQLAPTPIDQGGAGAFKSPSLTLDRGGNLKATWSNNGRVYYFDETGQVELSENGIHPIVETYGDRTSVVWQEEIAPGVYQIAKRNKGPLGWGEKQVISYPDSKNADFPVVAANGQYVYSKNTTGNDYDIVWHGEYENGWLQYERNISSASGGISKYPSVAFRQLWPKSKLYILWSEDLPDAKAAVPAKPVKIYAQEIDPVPYFYADLGTEEASVYTIQKAGTLIYGQTPDLTVDYHPTQLKYSFTGLDPARYYMLKAVYYHESNDRIQQKMKVDGQQFDVANLKTKEKVEFKRWLMPKLYSDGQIDITIDKQKGEYAVCAVLSIEEYEKDCDQTNGGGAQTTESKPITATFSYALMQNTPNPCSQHTAINYQLAKQGQVSLKVYNTLGQVVKTLVSENQNPGSYNVKWDGKDEAGRQVTAGIFFYRLSSGEFNSTKKMVVLR